MTAGAITFCLKSYSDIVNTMDIIGGDRSPEDEEDTSWISAGDMTKLEQIVLIQQEKRRGDEAEEAAAAEQGALEAALEAANDDDDSSSADNFPGEDSARDGKENREDRDDSARGDNAHAAPDGEENRSRSHSSLKTAMEDEEEEEASIQAANPTAYLADDIQTVDTTSFVDADVSLSTTTTTKKSASAAINKKASLKQNSQKAMEQASIKALQLAAKNLDENDDEEEDPLEDEAALAAQLVLHGNSPDSFIGFLKDSMGRQSRKPRIFSSSGESHGVSRSIGDKYAARGCVSTPEIKTAWVTAGSAARIVVCSDGVWDCFSSEQLCDAIRGYRTMTGAAKAVCSKAHSRRFYGGFSMDDISAIVVDIGGVSTVHGAPMCGGGCVVQ